jgi:hypothetical protein
MDNMTMPIILLMSSGGTGNPAELAAFNYFFTVVCVMAFVLFVPVAGARLLGRS